MAIALRTTQESGGSMKIDNPTGGGGRVVVELGPPES
jgi:hypothetical protein